MNKVCVKGQRIYFYRPPEPIPKSQVNFSKIEFDMDETWSSFLSVVAQFIQNGEPKNVQVEDGYCFVPSELVVGAFELCLRGDDGESVVASVNRLTFEVCEGFDPSGETPLPPSPDLYTQLIKEIDSGKKIAQSVREDADSGKFNGPPGKSPKIIDGNWYVWDDAAKDYVDTGIDTKYLPPLYVERMWGPGPDGDVMTGTNRYDFDKLFDAVFSGKTINVFDNVLEDNGTWSVNYCFVYGAGTDDDGRYIYCQSAAYSHNFFIRESGIVVQE